jgi:drug/metabolite transporter (DMT)-like permease
MSPNLVIGCAAAFAAALLGAGWQLATRHGVTTTLGPPDVALLRYGIPALVLLPVWWRVGWRPARLGWPGFLLLVAGGLPFGLFVLSGAQHAPVAHMGVFMAGMTPVFTALLAAVLQREPLTAARCVGLAVIVAGVALLGQSSFGGSGHWRGDLLFLCAALAWAAYTVAFRRSGLGPWEAAAVVNGWSAMGLLLCLPWAGALRLSSAPLGDVLLQALWQGVLAGLVGQIAFMAAVARLGSSRAALSGALVPVLSAMGGVLLLGEPIGPRTGIAVGLVCAGVVLASGAVALRWPPLTFRTGSARDRGSA